MILDRIASPVRLWRLSISLRGRGHVRLAVLVKQLNALLYHNSLPPQAKLGSNIKLWHHSFGVIIHGNVEIGNGVQIWQHATLAVQASPGAPAKIVIEDGVRIGANAVIITPFGKSIRIGRRARIGAGAVITKDIPPGVTAVSQPVRLLDDRAEQRLADKHAVQPQVNPLEPAANVESSAADAAAFRQAPER
jgi:serine O-acetyltransferase